MAVIRSGSYDSRFYYLGERTYVHSSDFVQELMNAIGFWSLGTLNYLKICCRNRVFNQGSYHLILEADSEEDTECDVLFNIICDGKPYTVILNQNDEPVSQSVADNEENLVADAQLDLDADSISFSWQVEQAPLMKLVVALHKKLLQETFSSATHGKWSLYKLDLAWSEFEKPGVLRIKKEAALGKQNARSSIYLDDQKVGTIYFWRPKLS